MKHALANALIRLWLATGGLLVAAVIYNDYHRDAPLAPVLGETLLAAFAATLLLWGYLRQRKDTK